MAAALLPAIHSAHAYNITIFDGVANNGGSSNPGDQAWWNNRNEDQETEPKTVHTQAWDLEAFDLSGSKLTMIGGYNFRAGESGYYSGDIFIDVHGDALYGPAADFDIPSGPNGYHRSANLWNYDYVIHFHKQNSLVSDNGTPGDPSDDVYGTQLTGKYDIIDIRGRDVTLLTAFVDANEASNPWRYEGGGRVVAANQDILNWSSINTTYTDAQIQGAYGISLLGGTHRTLEVDLSPLPKGVLFHYTMGCGNDNLMGRNVPDGGLTVGMLGSGLLGLGLTCRALGRRQR